MPCGLKELTKCVLCQGTPELTKDVVTGAKCCLAPSAGGSYNNENITKFINLRFCGVREKKNSASRVVILFYSSYVRQGIFYQREMVCGETQTSRSWRLESWMICRRQSHTKKSKMLHKKKEIRSYFVTNKIH